MVVEDSFEAFQKMYADVIQETQCFKDLIQIKDGKFYIDSQESKSVQKRLLMEVNDNVHKNMEGFSVKLFD